MNISRDINSLTNLQYERLKNIKCFIMDMDGTVYLSDTVIDGARGFFEFLDDKMINYYFYTNNSSKNAEFYKSKLKRLALGNENNKVLISNSVVINHIKDNYNGAKVYLLGTDYLRNDFIANGINLVDESADKADIVVVGFDTTVCYEGLDRACYYIRHGAEFFGVNPDLNCIIKDGELMPDCGSICKLIETSAGKAPVFFGKPSKYTLDYILKVTGYDESEVAMVGDKLVTDIKTCEGTDVLGILVLSGETSEKDLPASSVKPGIVVDDIKNLAYLLRQIHNR